MPVPEPSPVIGDRIIHERARLLILTYLASTDKKLVPFTELQEKFDFTAGNLSVQLKTLKAAGYISITKKFQDNKPLTQAAITGPGGQALRKYVDEMEMIINALKPIR